MNCLADERDTLRHAAERCGALECVVATDLLAPDASASGRFELEIVLATERVEAHILEAIAGHRLAVADVSQRGEPTHTIVTARA